MDDERRGHPSPDREPGQGAWVGSASGPAVTDGGPTPGTDRLAPSLLSTLEGRSPYVTTCPFLRAATDDGSLDVPVEDPDYVNRCAAFGEPKPQSLRQQELACLTSAHAECPRYLRGLVVTHDRLTSVPEARRLSRPILASVGILGLSLGASLAFVLARGGLELPVATGAANGVAGATATPTVGPTLVAQPPSVPPPTPGPTLAPATPEPTPAPTPAPTPPPTPQPTPPPTPEPQPTSDRYQYLEPCPTTPDCWIYVIRYGDALYNLANYFGHSLDTVYRLNPWARNGIQPGDQLILPPPTR